MSDGCLCPSQQLMSGIVTWSPWICGDPDFTKLSSFGYPERSTGVGILLPRASFSVPLLARDWLGSLCFIKPHLLAEQMASCSLQADTLDL